MICYAIPGSLNYFKSWEKTVQGENQYFFSIFMKEYLTLRSMILMTSIINPLSAKLTKWPNTLKQFVGNLPTNRVSVFGHFVGLALKGLN